MQKNFLGALMIIISAIGFGLIPFFARSSYNFGLSVTTLLFFRFLIAFFFFAIFLIKSEQYTFCLPAKQIASLFLLGGFLYSSMAFSYYSAVKYIPASLAVLILYIYPIIVTVLAFKLDKEKIPARTVAALFIAFNGLVLVLGPKVNNINIRGMIFAFVSAFAYSLYIVMGNRVVKRVHPIVTSTFITLFASLSFFVVGMISDSLKFNFSYAAWVPIFQTALINTVIPVLMFFKGLEIIGSSKASILSMIEPLTTIFVAAILYNEMLQGIQLIGGGAVLAGAFLVIIPRKLNQSKLDGNHNGRNSNGGNPEK